MPRRPSSEESDYWEKMLAQEGLAPITAKSRKNEWDDDQDGQAPGLEIEPSDVLPEDFSLDGGDALIEDLDTLTIVETDDLEDS